MNVPSLIITILRRATTVGRWRTSVANGSNVGIGGKRTLRCGANALASKPVSADLPTKLSGYVITGRGSAVAWWKKAFLSLGFFVVWFFGLIVVGGQGYPSQYFWASGAVVAIAFAVAPFWRLRSLRWYWPTITLLVVSNLALLYLEGSAVGNRDLPAKGIVQLLFVLDCLTCWGVMVCVCWLSCRQYPWQLLDQP